MGRKFQRAQNPNLQTTAYDPEKEYPANTLVSFSDPSSAKMPRGNTNQQKTLLKEMPLICKVVLGKKLIRMTMKSESVYSHRFNAFSVMPLNNRTGIGAKGPNPHTLWAQNFISRWMDEK